MSERHDVVIVGGGHNALVAATLLARQDLDVVVLERLPHVGGAAVSAAAFDGHDAHVSRFSYLVSLFPDALIAELGLELALRSRATASYTPYDGGGLLVETTEGPLTRASFRELTGGDREHDAWQRFYAEVASAAAVIAPTLLGPLPKVETLRTAIDPVVWTDLVEQPFGAAVERRFRDDLVRGVVATDALIGTYASLFDPTLVQNRCFLYHLIGNATGEWRVPVGGMGAVTTELARAATDAGARLVTDAEVISVDAHADRVVVHTADTSYEADWLLSGVAPWTLAGLRGRPLPPKPSGAQLKVNLLVSRLPALASGTDPRIAFAGTLHLDETFSQLEAAHAGATRGVGAASGEIYCHTLTDRSILGPELAAGSAQTLTYFGLHLPHDTLAAPGAKDAAVAAFLATLNRHLAEPIEPLILGIEAKTPAEIESELGMPGGHIFHGDLQWPWLEDGERPTSPAEAWGVATDHHRILLCGSGSRRGGAVSGLGGHSAAQALLETLAPVCT